MPSLEPSDYDVIIVGGGPAGLSAALVLGRCRRRVVVFDDGHPRNATSPAVHNYLGGKGITPGELRRRGREALAPLDHVTIIDRRIVEAKKTASGFVVVDATHDRTSARKILLATGVIDNLPDTPGASELWGRGLYSCAYCDGWEVRDQPLAAFAPGDAGAELALALTTWSSDVILLTNAGECPSADQKTRLRRYGVHIREERVLAFEGDNRLRAIVLAGGERLSRAAAFIHLGHGQRSPLAKMLGCETKEGEPPVSGRQETCVTGVYLAGDAAEDVQFAIVAAAEGARAAHAIHEALRKEPTP